MKYSEVLKDSSAYAAIFHAIFTKKGAINGSPEVKEQLKDIFRQVINNDNKTQIMLNTFVNRLYQKFRCCLCYE